MLENLPMYIPLVFWLTTVAELSMFYWVLRDTSTPETRIMTNYIIIGLVVWLLIQAGLSLTNFYSANTTSLPPRILLLPLPPVLLMVFLFSTKSGRNFINSLPLLQLSWLNVIRIPVELVLFWLFLHKAVPQLMTFTGRNFDILAGITAPFIIYLCFKNPWSSKNQQNLDRPMVLLIWNIISLLLLLNIIISAILSAPLAIQQFAFEQPNIAVFYFPFSWLPSFAAPMVLFGHLVSIRRLWSSTQ